MGTRCRSLAMFGMALAACGQAPPDVVLLTLDTTRVDHLGVYGYQRPVSPAIDAFAREALVFRRAWAPAPWTLPSHASMLTGKHPTSHGAHFDAKGGDSYLSEVVDHKLAQIVRVNRLGEEQITLAELLRERGYATAAFAGGPWLSPGFGLLQGYELQDADVRDLAGRSAAELTNRALAWLEGLPRRRPVHLLVNYFDPHTPYEPPPEFRALALEGETRPDSRSWHSRAIDNYDGEIRFMDRQIERLLDALRATGRYDGALIIMVSDHGELFGEHGLRAHPPFHYEPLLRVPLLVRLPGGRAAGREIDAPFSLVDLLPLIAEEVGLALPRGVEGVRIGERRVVLAQSFRDPVSIVKYGDRADRDLTSVIRWPWKLTVSDRGTREIYRLERDPAESHNLSGRVPIEDQLVRELEGAVSALLAPDSPAPPEELSPGTLERLRELGYVP